MLFWADLRPCCGLGWYALDVGSFNWIFARISRGRCLETDRCKEFRTSYYQGIWMRTYVCRTLNNRSCSRWQLDSSDLTSAVSRIKWILMSFWWILGRDGSEYWIRHHLSEFPDQPEARLYHRSSESYHTGINNLFTLRYFLIQIRLRAYSYSELRRDISFQVLADLAVDIHAFKDRQCAIVIWNFCDYLSSWSFYV